VGKGAPVVSPARAEGSFAFDLSELTATVSGVAVPDLALGSPWGGGEVGNGGAARPEARRAGQPP
jgi:hypothetical protein